MAGQLDELSQWFDERERQHYETMLEETVAAAAVDLEIIHGEIKDALDVDPNSDKKPDYRERLEWVNRKLNGIVERLHEAA